MCSMISEQIKQLKEEAKYLEKDQEKRLASILEQAADTIEALSAKLAENGGEWIACDDRLPEEDIDVLIQVSGKFRNVTFEDSFELGTYIRGEGWFIESYPDWENPNVIAWQPLPKEPYRP